MQPLKIYLLWLLSAFMLTPCHADTQMAIEQHLSYQDPHNQQSISEVMQLPADSWRNQSGNNFNFGYSQSTHWIKFSLNNKSSFEQHLLLDVNYPLIDHIQVFQINKSKAPVNILTSGDRVNFQQRTISHPNFISPITLPSNTEQIYVVRLKSNSPIQGEILTWQFDDFQKYYRQQASIRFFYLGIILCCALLTLLIYLFIQDKTYLYFSLYALSFSALLASQYGLIFEHILYNYPDLHNWSQLLFASASITFTALFNRRFLNLNHQAASSQLMLLCAAVPVFILLISPLTSYALSIKLIVVSGLIILPGCFFVGLYHHKAMKNSYFFISAWLCLFAGVIIFLLARLGLIEFNQFNNHAILVGSTLELVIFAIALAKRINEDKELRIQAQQLIIENSLKTAKLHKELLYNATHSEITGLPNRNYFEHWLDKKLNEKHNATLVLFHLSRNHEIDKTLGRDVSNRALEQLSMRLNGEAATLDNIETIESTENFHIATLSNSTHGLLINGSLTEQSINAIKQLQDKINKPLMVNGIEIEPFIHCAYCKYPEHGTTANILLRHSGIALDTAQDSQDNLSGYEESDNPYSERRLNLVSELKNAIINDSLELYYQPLILSKTEKVMGAEALIRWPHDTHGLIMPDEFIDIAEKTGIIQSLSLWVLRDGLKQLKNWLNLDPSFLLSVNISALNLQNDKFIEALNLILLEYPNQAQNLILEITETQLMSDTKNALKNLWALSELGMRIAIDDFGTGYSNLAYLKRIPATELKIDKSFILNLESDPQNKILVETAIQMAHNLGLKVVAEGVESARSFQLLQSLNCDICQGYHFSRPIPVEQFNKFFAQHR